MEPIHAAVVTSFDKPPRYLPFTLPEPPGGTIIVDVLAVGLHPRVRSGASGRHYTSTGTLPMIPGIDGVGRRPDGALVYFATDDDVVGTMAERAVVDPRRTVELPESADVATVAAAMNPAMSSWVALRQRVPLQRGQRVLVLGATGNAGTMAVRIAKLLGAEEVIGAGRDPERLEALTAYGADATVRLTDDEAATGEALAVAADVDVVVDYLWGSPTQHALMALLTRRADRSAPLDWIQIGAVAGPTIELPSVALRSANLRLVGTGQGSVSPREYVAQLPSLIAELGAGTIPVATRTTPLADVEQVWSEPEAPGVRTVLVP
jgi:NADPH:quinone reductase-like Zn-dependent oxidoreductase